MNEDKIKNKLMKYAYFIETHLSNEDNKIKIYASPKNEYIDSFEKIDNKLINKEKEYICSMFKVGIKITETKNSNLELKIILNKDDTEFESKNNIDLKTNNFLGLIKFGNYRGWLGTYKPPETYNLSNYEIFDLLNEVLLIKEKIKYNDNIYYDFINYGFYLYNTCSQNKLELFILLYINILNGDNYLLIETIFECFPIENKINDKKKVCLSIDINKLEKIYKRQDIIFNQLILYESNKILTHDLEFYLKKFYTIYIYILNLLEGNNKIEFILKDLSHNKFDKLILPKLYLTEYHTFYDNIIISNEIKLILSNKLIEASNSYSNLITSFTLISKYVNKDFVKILTIIINNYDNINKICYKEKKEIKIIDYVEQNINDNLIIIKEKLDFILSKNKENNYKCICFSIDIFLFYIKETTNVEFLCFVEEKLFESSINFEDIKNYLIFSSNKRNKRINLILELVLNKYEKINLLSKEENKAIFLVEYIKPNIEDDLMKIKNLITAILEKQKNFSYNCIKFDIKMLEFYSNIDNLDKLKFIQSIIKIIKEVDTMNEEEIGLPQKIHKVGMNMIKEGKMESQKVLQFLKEDELLYNNKRIDYLTSKTNDLYYENENIKKRCSILENDIYKKNLIINDLKSENKDLKLEIKDLKLEIENLKKKLDSNSYDIRSLRLDLAFKKNI